jgi:hypothetical protein
MLAIAGSPITVHACLVFVPFRAREATMVLTGMPEEDADERATTSTRILRQSMNRASSTW